MRLSQLLLPTLALSVLSQLAIAVPITNPSFESNLVLPGNFADGNAGWDDLGSFGRFRGNGDFGQGAGPTAGSQIAYLSPTTDAYQDLTSTYAALTGYTLSVDIAVREELSDTGTFTLWLYQNDDRFDVVKSVSVAYNTLVADQFTTLSITATAADVLLAGAVGETMGVGFRNASTANDFDLDNVQLNVVPEPASASLLAGGVLLVARRRYNLSGQKVSRPPANC